MSGEKVFPLDELEPGSAKKVVLGGIPIAVVRDSAIRRTQRQTSKADIIDRIYCMH